MLLLYPQVYYLPFISIQMDMPSSKQAIADTVYITVIPIPVKLSTSPPDNHNRQTEAMNNISLTKLIKYSLICYSYVQSMHAYTYHLAVLL